MLYGVEHLDFKKEEFPTIRGTILGSPRQVILQLSLYLAPLLLGNHQVCIGHDGDVLL